MIYQAYLSKDGAPSYTDKQERIKRNKAEGFKRQRVEAGMDRDEL